MKYEQSYHRYKDRLYIPKYSATAMDVLERRYLRRDKAGTIIETPSQMLWRVAWSVAAAELLYGPEETRDARQRSMAMDYYDLMAQGRFLPNSPTLMNAGTDMGQLAACFVLPVPDSMEGIFDAVKQAAIIHKTGGGTGFSFSRLRAKGSVVGSTSGVASGPVSFSKVFDVATEQVKQGGKRRGANMGVLRVDHPDIEEFIQAKDQPGVLENFNFSVGITDEFMEALEAGTAYPLRDPQNRDAIVGHLEAREVWDLLVRSAWRRGDPGVLFLDRINAGHKLPKHLGEIEATNPCGEVPLLPYEACNLGSMNFSAYVEDGVFDWEGLKGDVQTAVRFLDSVIDVGKYPMPEIEAQVKQTRKIGLGIMGWADALFKLGLPYDSESAVNRGRAIWAQVHEWAEDESRTLATERGECPAWPGSGQRNGTLTTIAPTGTLSILAGCSSGIEPVYALAFERRIMDDDIFLEVNPVFKGFLSQYHYDIQYSVLKKIVAGNSLGDDLRVRPDIRRVFVTAMDVSPGWHLEMQAAFQMSTDNAVSKTVNMPHFATHEQVDLAYRDAYRLGCKGVTIYRDGCRGAEGQVLTVGQGVKGAEQEQQPESPSDVRVIRDRPEELRGVTRAMKTGLGKLYLTVNELDGKPFEVFATIGKSGRSAMAKAEGIGRLVSLALRSGIAVEEIVAQLEGIGGEHPMFREKGLVLSIPDAVAQMLRSWVTKDIPKKQHNGLLPQSMCPDCGAELVFEEGCHNCKACGWTKCGG